MKSLIHSGELLQGESLQKEYRLRKSDNEVTYLKKEDSIPEGWKKQELKTKIKLYRPKPLSRSLEDKLWCLFYELGANQICSREFSIYTKEKGKAKVRKQIDICAIIDEVLFIVECKTQAELETCNELNKEIRNFAATKHSTKTVIQNITGLELVPVFIVATENINWTDSNILCAKDQRIQVFNEGDIKKLRELARLAGNAAVYQLYNQIFYGHRIKKFSLKIPALESRMGGKTYYTFNMLPEHLLKISFIHQRSRTLKFQELSDSYQRMIKPSRIKQIESFINDGGFFPGNIILNFKHKPKIEDIGPKKDFYDAVGGAKPVMLTLPQYYGCAWIIDGQHRLYGYADTDKKRTETVPVVPFVNESTTTQAKMFVDINKNQKAIETDLLWDLYEDLYSESDDEKEMHLCAVSKLVKLLNIKGPFKSVVKIPKDGNVGEIDIKTLCRGIHHLDFIGSPGSPFFLNDHEMSIGFAADRLNAYFHIFEEYLIESWNRGKEGFIRSTAGIGILLNMLSDFVPNLHKDEISSIYKFTEYFEKLMIPLIEHLEKSSTKELHDYTTASVGRAQTSELQAKFTKIIKEKSHVAFRSRFLEKWHEREKEIATDNILEILKQEENKSLEFKGSIMLNIDRLIKAEADGKVALETKIAMNGVIKTIAAFCNKDGGDIIIGVIEKNKYPEIEDEGTDDFPAIGRCFIVGIEKEFEYERGGSVDSYENKLRDLIRDHIDPNLGLNIEITFHKYKGKTICRIKVPPSERTFVDDDKFYVREGNRTIELKGKSLDEFLHGKD